MTEAPERKPPLPHAAPWSRRAFLGGMAAGAVGASALLLGRPASAQSSRAITAPPELQHAIPADKRLTAAWLQSLTDLGPAETWRGNELRFVSIPVSGIGTGLLCLSGYGRLVDANLLSSPAAGPGVGDTPEPAPAFLHGFAVAAEASGERRARVLDEMSFGDLSCVPQATGATVRYADRGFPLEVELTVGAPFSPGDLAFSSQPVVALTLKVTNTSSEPVGAACCGWMQNPASFLAAQAGARGHRASVLEPTAHGSVWRFSSHPAEEADTGAVRREAISIGHLGESLTDWDHSGGTVFQPERRADRHTADAPLFGVAREEWHSSKSKPSGTTGSLVSQQFQINRRYVNVLAAGNGLDGAAQVQLRIGSASPDPVVPAHPEVFRWYSFDVSGQVGRTAVLAAVDESGSPDHWIALAAAEMSDTARYGAPVAPLDGPDRGDFAFMLLGGHDTEDGEDSSGAWRGLDSSLDRARWRGESVAGLENNDCHALATPLEGLDPGEQRETTFLVAWNLPDSSFPFAGVVGGSTAADLASHIASDWPRVAGRTGRWREAWRRATLPPYLKTRYSAASHCLRAWPAHSLGIDSPPPTGRAPVPLSVEHVRRTYGREIGANWFPGLAACDAPLNLQDPVDGRLLRLLAHCGELLRTGDTQRLSTRWSSLREEYQRLLAADDNGNGLLPTPTPTSWGTIQEGQLAQLSSLTVAAWRAGVEMASAAGDEGMRSELEERLARAIHSFSEVHWRGSFFGAAGVEEPEGPQPWKDACDAGQLEGQGWAWHLGLGPIAAGPRVNRAVAFLYEANWNRDLGPQRELWPVTGEAAEPNAGGLVRTTWPTRPASETRLAGASRVSLRLEYEVAAQLLETGRLTEALAIVRQVHERSDARVRNPVRDVDFEPFSRGSQAFQRVLDAACGLRWNGVSKTLSIGPRLGIDDFQVPVVAGNGWGQLHWQIDGRRLRATVTWQDGDVMLDSLRLRLAHPVAKATTRLRVSGTDGDHRSTIEGDEVVVWLSHTVELAAGDELDLLVKT